MKVHKSAVIKLDTEMPDQNCLPVSDNWRLCAVVNRCFATHDQTERLMLRDKEYRLMQQAEAHFDKSLHDTA